MSGAKSIGAVISVIFGIIMAGYFGWQIIQNTQEIAETPDEDAYYEAHGRYVSDGGNMYTCPNGAPPQPDANPEVFAHGRSRAEGTKKCDYYISFICQCDCEKPLFIPSSSTHISAQYCSDRC